MHARTGVTVFGVAPMEAREDCNVGGESSIGRGCGGCIREYTSGSHCQGQVVTNTSKSSEYATARYSIEELSEVQPVQYHHFRYPILFQICRLKVFVLRCIRIPIGIQPWHVFVWGNKKMSVQRFLHFLLQSIGLSWNISWCMFLSQPSLHVVHISLQI